MAGELAAIRFASHLSPHTTASSVGHGFSSVSFLAIALSLRFSTTPHEAEGACGIIYIKRISQNPYSALFLFLTL